MGGDGILYALDARNHRVQKFSRNGDYLSSWGSGATEASSLEKIAGITVSEKYVFLADAKYCAIQAWFLDGTHRWTENLTSRLDDSSGAPAAVSVTPKGLVYVLDGPGARVLRFRLHL